MHARRLWGQALLCGLAALGGCAHRPARVALLPDGAAYRPSARAFAVPKSPFGRPADDPFHAQPARATLAAAAPGTILRYRPIRPRAYHLTAVHAQGWQLVYRSNDTNGRPIADVATLLIPPAPARKLLSYQVAYDGLTRRCAPSREILSGGMIEQLFVSRALRRHWMVVLPDYEGPRSEFTAGVNSGHGVLDGIRAARGFLPTNLADAGTPVALWGYSGGAYASLWAAQLAASYAPTLPIVGVAAGGPPADLLTSARHLDGGVFAGMYMAAFIGLARAYPQIDSQRLLNANGEKMFAKLQQSCIGQELAGVRDPILSGTAWRHMSHFTTVDDLLAVPAVQQIGRANRLGKRPLDAPLFYYQAWFDEVTPREQARALARRYCRAGNPVRFEWALGDHISAAVTHASNAVDYLAARFDGKRVPDDCQKLLQGVP